MMDQRPAPLASSQSLTVIARSNGGNQKPTGQGPAHQGRATPFVAQLLAARHAAMAYRQKRRATPEEAGNAYRATSGLRNETDSLINIAA